MQKADKERVVAELVERLRTTDTLIVADYRGLTMSQIDKLRTELLEHGARFTVVKNTLTRRAAEAAEADALLTLLDGPTAIAFLESDGDPVAVAKALAATARETRVLEVRGGILEGRPISGTDVAELARLPAGDVLRGQVLGAITAPLYTLVGLFTAPLNDLVGLLDARIAQLGEQEQPQAAESEETSEEPEAPEGPQTPTADATGAVEATVAEETETESDQPREEEEQ
jgi:large subunit ribosomal protein L10